MNVKEEKRLPPSPPPAFPNLVGGKLGCIPENAERSNKSCIFLQDGRYFQVLTNAVGISEYGMLVMLSHVSVEGS